VAGGTGEGVIAAADETGHFAIGVDSDQDYLAPGHVLTSMLKRADVAVFQLIQRTVNGEPAGGILRLGLANGGIDLSPMIYTRHLIPRDVSEQLAQIRQMILDGAITVTDITMF
ncbi:MAG: BMP family ABC transporter substrate-binding protein, partial [Deinococcus sp.]|nr:BMP family ABC transporter substrate-binding protein [Deinococcus sp.]